MTTEDHGKKISEIWYAGDGNTMDSRVQSDESKQLELSATHHGDHDEFWVLVKKDGIEVERLNAKFLSSIVWA